MIVPFTSGNFISSKINNTSKLLNYLVITQAIRPFFPQAEHREQRTLNITLPPNIIEIHLTASNYLQGCIYFIVVFFTKSIAKFILFFHYNKNPDS